MGEEARIEEGMAKSEEAFPVTRLFVPYHRGRWYLGPARYRVTRHGGRNDFICRGKGVSRGGMFCEHTSTPDCGF